MNNMDNSECSHHVNFGKNANTGDLESRDLRPATDASEQATEESAKMCASNIEADNTTFVSDVNLEVAVEVDTHNSVQCSIAENPRVSSSALPVNQLLSKTTCETAVGVESSENAAIVCEIVEEEKIQISQAGEILDQSAELSSRSSSVVATTSASAADNLEELRTSSNVNAEIKACESEMVLPHNSDGGMKSANAAAAAAASAHIEETESVSRSTDHVSQLQDTFGTDIEDLLVMRSDAQLPPLQENENSMVVVLYDVEDRNEHPEKVPDPSPCSPKKDKRHMSDRNYVLMPYATEKWQKISTVLTQLSEPIHSWYVVEDAIKKYHDYPEVINFSSLQECFCEKDGGNTFLSGTCLLDLVPKIAKLAIDLPNVCTRAIRLLRRQKNFTIAMSQYQAACLLANAFFCTFPPTASWEFADVNFTGLYRYWPDDRRGSQRAKLECIFNYFRRVTTSMPTGIITFRRQVS